MFATLTHCLLLSKYCVEQDCFPIFSIENELYGADWFNRFFRLRTTPTARDQTEAVLLEDRLQINAFTRGATENEISDELTSIAEGARLFHRFLEIKEEIRSELEVQAESLIRGRTVGVHYRGTDKFLCESLPVTHMDVFEAIERTAGLKTPIFLATDDRDFFRFIATRVPPPLLRYQRAPDGPSHYEQAATFEKGLEALTDAGLLSKCSVVIKTSSLLSAWSVIFNPDLPVVLVGGPKENAYPEDHALQGGAGYFPENLLHRRKTNAKVAAVLLPSHPPTAW